MRIPRHPFSVCGRIEQCWLFVYRVTAAEVQPLLPPGLHFVTHGGFAFWNIVVSRLRAMRPRGFPAFTGVGYWHVAYRLHVQAKELDGRALEGLYFVRSDCDRWLLAAAGNALTDFDFHHATISVREKGPGVTGNITVPEANARFQIDRTAAPQLSLGSPFPDLASAAKALQYRPFALSPAGAETMNIVRVVRDETEWRSRLVAVPVAEWQFLSGCAATLELCYEIAPIDYTWERGRAARVQP